SARFQPARPIGQYPLDNAAITAPPTAPPVPPTSKRNDLPRQNRPPSMCIAHKSRCSRRATKATSHHKRALPATAASTIKSTTESPIPAADQKEKSTSPA